MQLKKLGWVLAVVVLGSFAVLGTQGVNITRQLPPIPDQVVTADGAVLLRGESIRNGQNVWQSVGGQQVGP